MADLLTTDKAAPLIKNQDTGKLGVSIPRVLQLIKDGILEGEKLGRIWVTTPRAIAKLNKTPRPIGAAGHKKNQ